jgi:hypothetical protein
MPNPIKAIKGGVQGVKNANLAVKVNNTMAKNPNQNKAMGAPLKKQILGPLNIAKGFVNGAKDPSAAEVKGEQLRSFRNAQKKK